MTAPTRQDHPKVYIAANADGSWDAFVEGVGFRANVRLPQATEFIRAYKGWVRGTVPCWDRQCGEWTSEIDIAEGT